MIAFYPRPFWACLLAMVVACVPGGLPYPCPPELRCGSWLPTAVEGAPAARDGHAAVWTGAEMIVWGGFDGDAPDHRFFDSGGRYDPSSDTWTSTTFEGAPEARGNHTAVWTGLEMIVWGGRGEYGPLASGAAYDPVSDTWRPITETGAPEARRWHTAVWSGSEMIVWGGERGVTDFATGGRHDPDVDTWSMTTLKGAPEERKYHTAVWTGSEMIVWGGSNCDGLLGSGGRYDPKAERWTALPEEGAPQARSYHTAVWTGSVMLAWGGAYTLAEFDDGGRYDPGSEEWAAIEAAGAPEARAGPMGVWTGTELIIWGGSHRSGGPGAQSLVQVASGGRYDPGSGTWFATALPVAPAPRVGHVAVWTGTEMVVWGGAQGESVGKPVSYLDTGGRFVP